MLHFVTRLALARASERGFRQHGCVGAVAAYAGEGIGFGLVSSGHAMPARSAKITESGSFGAVPTTCGRQALSMRRTPIGSQVLCRPTATLCGRVRPPATRRRLRPKRAAACHR
jgi:hypothetical protein